MAPRCLAFATAAIALLAPAAGASAAIVPGRAVDGPSANIVSIGNVDVAPDGTGAVVYVKKDGGTDHVFVSRIANGSFAAPQRADVGGTGAASDPRVAASNGGKLVAVFTTADGMDIDLRSAISAGTGQPFVQSPVNTAIPSWLPPDVDANAAGQAYVTAASNAANPDAYAFRLSGTTWTQVGATPLDSTAGDQAGGSMAQDQSRIAVTGDGNAVAAWPEKPAAPPNNVYARRLTGTTQGAAVLATVPTLGSRARGDNALMVDVAAEGNDAWLAFREDFTYPPNLQKARIIARRLTGGAFGPAQPVDGLPDPAPDGAEQPSLAVNDAGLGLVGTYRQLADEAHGARLAGGNWTAAGRIDPPPTDGKPFTTAAIGGNGAGLLAFNHRPNNTVDPAIRARTHRNGALGAVQPLSDPALGPVDNPSANNPTSAADADGDVAVAWKQGAAANSRIVLAIVDGPAPPGGGGAPGPAPGPPLPPGPGTDLVDPLMTGTSLSRNRFAVGRGAPELVATGRRRRTPIGTRISFTLSEASRVTFRFRRAAKGRRVGRRCVKPTRRNRGRRRCRRFTRAGAFAVDAAAGGNVLRFSGRVNRRRKLKLGRHRMTITPRDLAGNRGRAVRRSFRIVARRRTPRRE